MEATYDNVIEQITQSIYATMLNIELVRVDALAPSDPDSLLAAVQIAGQWTGSVVLALSSDVARESAAAILRLDRQNVTEADGEDVAAKLVNMIGGNLKSLLPGPSFLSLPTIVVGREFGLHIHNAALVDDVAHSFRMRLLAGAGVLEISRINCLHLMPKKRRTGLFAVAVPGHDFNRHHPVPSWFEDVESLSSHNGGG